jgi:hypothetical protein
MLLLEGYISNFRCASYSLSYIEFNDNDLYVNQSLAGIIAGHCVCSLVRSVDEIYRNLYRIYKKEKDNVDVPTYNV